MIIKKEKERLINLIPLPLSLPENGRNMMSQVVSSSYPRFVMESVQTAALWGYSSLLVPSFITASV